MIMKKAIFIGELTLNNTLLPDRGVKAHVGDRIVAAALLDGSMDLPTTFVGETASDAVGDRIVTTLADAKVDVSSIDRYTDGASAVRIAASDLSAAPAIHTDYPPEPVNPVWPRIDEGDVVVFGGFMAIEERNHARVLELVRYARSRKAEVVYLPYFETSKVRRITRVMPQIFDNLEAATMVMASADDLAAIFPGETPDKTFKDHILFYCPRCLVVDHKEMQMHFFDHDRSWTAKCHPSDTSVDDWVAGAVAGTVRALAEGMRDPDDLMERANETAHSTLASSLQ